MTVENADPGLGNETATPEQAANTPGEAVTAPEPAATPAQETPAIATPDSGETSKPADAEASFLPRNPEEAAADPKPGDAPAEDEGGDFTLSFPEGFEVDEQKMAAFREMAKKGNIPNELAQEMFDYHHQELSAHTGRLMDMYQAKKQEIDTAWYKDLMADPEVGGANHEASMNYVEKAIRTVFPDEKERREFKAFHGADQANLNNHKLYVKFFKRVGEMLSESVPEAGESAGESEQESIAARLYKNVKF